MSRVNNIKSFEGVDPSASYLLLISPESIPHLVIIKEGKYYALTYKKAIIGDDFDQYLKILSKKGRKMLFFQLRHQAVDLAQIFSNYHQAESGKFTCFQPIKDWLSPVTDIEFVYQLIPFLYAEDQIIDASQLNMGELLDEQSGFELSEYKKEDIYSYIETLNKKYV